jgi:hypothetical protein
VASGLELVLAILLPGAGHVSLGETRRAPPAASFLGRHAGGCFAYPLSVTDAYRLAALAGVRRTLQP